MEPMFHFYLLTFATPIAGALLYTSVTTVQESQGVTQPVIQKAGEEAKLHQGSFLFSVSYLGHMTKEQFAPTPQAPSQDEDGGISPAYRMGYVAANKPEVRNPFNADGPDYEAWEHGLRDGKAAVSASQQ